MPFRRINPLTDGRRARPSVRARHSDLDRSHALVLRTAAPLQGRRLRKAHGHLPATKRIRKSSGEIPEAADAQPDRGAESILRSLPAERRPARSARDEGLQEVFTVGVPDQGLRRPGRARVRPYEFEEAEVRRRGVPQRDMTFAAPLKVTLRLIVFDIDEETGSRVDPRHQGAGRLHGRHAADDRQRHLHRQRHRARHRQPDAPLAGRLLRSRQGQDHSSGKYLFAARDHPLPRLVARLRVRRQGPVHVRIDRRRKIR